MDPKLTDNLDTLIHDIKECKYSLEMLLINLGNDEHLISENKIDWPSILNSLRIASTNLISISKFLKDKREILLKTSILMPKFFSEDVDPELQELTNNRISVFNQDVIPHILRTKLIPAIEEDEAKLQQAAKEFELNKSYDKSINYFKKTIEDSANMIEKPKRELESKQPISNTYNMHDTFQLVNVAHNLKIQSRQPNQRMQM